MANESGDLPGDVLFFPAHSKKRAKRLLKLAMEPGICEEGEVLGPKWRLKLGLDRATAQWLRVALSEQESIVYYGGALVTMGPAEARSQLHGLVEVLDEFLVDGARYPAERQEKRPPSENS